MNRIPSSRISRTIALALVCAITVALAAPASALTMSDLMKYLPPDGHIAIGIPDIQAVETAGAPMLRIGPLSEISSLAVALGGDTLSEGLANCGVNAAAPGAVFLSIPSANDIKVSGVLMVEDADKVKETMAGLIGGAADVSLPGDLTGLFSAATNVGYFISDNKLFVASSEALLQQLAARIGAPAEVNYTAKDEVVVWSRIDTILDNDLLRFVDQLSMLKPVLTTLKPFSDEVLLAIGEQAGRAYLRVASRDSEGVAIPSPGTLGLHGYMDADAPVLANLRITPTLINALATALSAEPATRQIGGYVRIASSLLGDEMAVSFRGMKAANVPDATIALTVKNAATVPNLLRMLARIEEPSYQHEETDVYVYEDGNIEVHIAVAGEVLVVTPGGDELKAALEAFSKEGAAGAPAAIVNRGVFGFAMVDGAKAQAAGIDIPNIKDLDLALTLGTDSAWREAVITSPAGFAGIASALQGVL